MGLPIKKFFLWTSGLILLFCAVLFFVLDFTTFEKTTSLTFPNAEGKEISATLYKGSKPFGILVAGDLGRDQIYLKAAVREFQQGGAHVLTMDYTGHGASEGSLTAKQIREGFLQEELKRGIALLEEQSNLTDEQVVLVGHGLGGREILRLISEEPDRRFAGAALAAPLLELGAKTLYFSEDDPSSGWMDQLGTDSLSVPIQILGTTKDDQVKTVDLIDLYSRLSGGNVSLKEEGFFQVSADGVSLEILEGIYHEHQMYSNQVIRSLSSWISKDLKLRSVSTEVFFPILRWIGWIVTGVFLLIALFCATALSRYQYEDDAHGALSIGIQNRYRFLGIKAASLLLALPLGWLIWKLLPLFSSGAPVQNLWYPSYLCGGGLLAIFLYAMQKMPFTRGRYRMRFPRFHAARILGSLFWTAVFSVYFFYLGQTGLYTIFVQNERVGWMVLLVLVSGVGAYVLMQEAAMLSRSQANFLEILCFWGIFFLPLAVPILFSWMSGNWTAAIQGALHLGALLLAVLIGNILRLYSNGILFSAVCVAVFYNLLTITMSAMIR